MSRRTLAELLDVEQPAWPEVSGWIATANKPVEALPSTEPMRGQALVESQVTVRSPMGAVIYETGGLLIDHGWMRVLGSGHPRLTRSLPEWNRDRCGASPEAPPPFLLVADDIAGGFFALDGGGLGPGRGHVYYHAPDSLRWESMGDIGYAHFLRWCLVGDLDEFYSALRWPGWEPEAAAVGGDYALSVYPPPWTREGKTIANCSRKAVPVAEIYDLHVNELPRQLGG